MNGEYILKIVILDGYALNPGDLSWDDIKALGDLTVYDRTPGDKIIERSAGAEILLTNKTPLMAETLEKLPDLRYIGVLATGYNVVDLDAAKQRGITVTNVPAYSTDSVAQMVFALILELTRHVQAHSDAVHRGEWVKSKDFSFWQTPQIELTGKTIGIIGFGQIGKAVARIADACGMRILATRTRNPEHPPLQGFSWADTNDILHESDIISLHAPLTPETQGLINSQTIELMKQSAFLINTARGPLVVEADLADALNSGRIAGAGLDVLSVEPPKPDNPLLTAKNCIITPHIAWATHEARMRLMDITVQNLKAFLAGKPINVVSG